MKIRDRGAAARRSGSASRRRSCRYGRGGRAASMRFLPVLYLRGISTGDFQEALAALLGKDAPNLSPSVIARLTAQWQAEYERWQERDLSVGGRTTASSGAIVSPRRFISTRSFRRNPCRPQSKADLREIHGAPPGPRPRPRSTSLRREVWAKMSGRSHA